MSNLDKYAAALLPVAPRVLGCELRPFTLGHALFLARMESPYLTGAAVPEWGDLVLAVELCRRDQSSLESALASFRLRFALRHLWPLRYLRWGRAWPDHSLEFAAYLARAWRRPETFRRGNTQPSGVPWLLYLQVVMMDWLHKTEAETLATPLQAAIWQVAAAAELRERIEWVNEEELAAMEDLKAMKGKA